MTDKQIQFSTLQQKLTDLQKRQELFQSEIQEIKKEIEKLAVRQESESGIRLYGDSGGEL